MFDRRHIFEIEALKAKSVRSTLHRFWKEFRERRLVLVVVLLLGIFSTWTFVITPDLISQVVDRYLTYAQQSISGMGQMGQSAQTNCWFSDDTATLSLGHGFGRAADYYPAGGAVHCRLGHNRSSVLSDALGGSACA
jgi:hypothetical protein